MTVSRLRPWAGLDPAPFDRLGQPVRLTLGDDHVGVVQEPVDCRGGVSQLPRPGAVVRLAHGLPVSRVGRGEPRLGGHFS